MKFLNQMPELEGEFAKMENILFVVERLGEYAATIGAGEVQCRRQRRKIREAFNQIVNPFEDASAWQFPPDPQEHPVLPLQIIFVSPRTVRVRLEGRPGTRVGTQGEATSPMLVREPGNDPWPAEESEGVVLYRSAAGAVKVEKEPFRLSFYDADGKLLTHTWHPQDNRSLLNCQPLPFAFLERTTDLRRFWAATFALAPEEKLFGGGESFTRLNKRGQRVSLWATDAHGVQTPAMYKPVPFFLSSRGYGMFVHTSAPLTFDFGCTYDGANTIFLGDEDLDLFFFIGNPKEILEEYTALTGRSTVPPLWSFGLWMSRITYKTEDEVREVATKLREERIPCDVIHLDTGWFEQDWQCDYQFSSTRFRDPAQMIADLRAQGFRISLWQLPYYSPANPLYQEAVSKGYVVRDADGKLPTRDAVVDFSNPEAVAWYQRLLRRLLEMGVAAIKADFGEGAPLHGCYASGRSGWHEHNLYPLRYNQAVAEVTEEVTGERIIWGRSAWAGSQRYPVHWGGDAENTNSGMAATLRGGLSLGLCGFSFWSHDIGGFVHKSPEELYRRWLPFGMLTSHSRCHGVPPKEPWAYGEGFTADFRRAVELKYRLLPYIYAQACLSVQKGHPLLRTLFFEYPDDPGAWLIEDEYFFGSDLLVAPLFAADEARDVYLPPGLWHDYQSGEVYSGGGWRRLRAGEIPVILLAREGTAIPHIQPALCTDALNWGELEVVVFAAEAVEATGAVCLPGEAVRLVHLRRENEGSFVFQEDPLVGKVRWQIRWVG